MNQTTCSTASSGTTVAVTAQLVYAGDEELIRAIKQVLRKAAKWKRECWCTARRKKGGVNLHCEGYGCASLDELLAPFKQFRFIGSAKQGKRVE